MQRLGGKLREKREKLAPTQVLLLDLRGMVILRWVPTKWLGRALPRRVGRTRKKNELAHNPSQI